MKFRRAIASFARRRRELELKFDQEIAKARAEKRAREAIQELYRDRNYELLYLQEEEDVFITNDLVETPRSLRLPLPPFTDTASWSTSQMDGEYYLQPEAWHALRASIRKEKQERSELPLRIITALTGVIGASIGLVAVMIRLAK